MERRVLKTTQKRLLKTIPIPQKRESVSAVLITQGARKFYTVTLESDILGTTCVTTSRAEDPDEGFQRTLDITRAKSIRDYIEQGGVIPGSIVLSAQDSANLYDNGKKKTIQFDVSAGAFLIIDGQHRVYWFKLSTKKLRVPVVIFSGLSKRDEARLFIDINTLQKSVPNQLLLDIKKLAETETEHQTEIDALQILYSRPFKQRITETMLKELEKKLRDNHAAWTEDRLWDAFATTAPAKVIGRSQAGRFADLVSLVRFALEQQPVLAPFADSVSERFSEWLMDKAKSGSVFTPEQFTWLNLIRDHIATSLSIEADDSDYSPFSQQGGLGKAYHLFGDQLPTLLAELNGVLVA